MMIAPHKPITKRVLLAAGVWCSLMTVAFVSPAVAAAQATTTHGARASTVLMAEPGITLEQAVARVQHKTHGKVLRAGSRQYGNTTEYRIKVLTPDGHVRVVPVRSPNIRTPEYKPKETH